MPASLAASLSTPLQTSILGAAALWWPHVPTSASSALSLFANANANGGPAPATPTPPSAAPDSPQSSPRIFLLFIPGNPGLAAYYAPYLTALHSHPALRGKLEILCVGHRGHAPLYSEASHPLHGSDRAYERAAASSSDKLGLRYQLAHKIAVLDMVASSLGRHAKSDANGNGHHVDHDDEARPQTKIIVSGHSVGAWMALQTLEARPHLVDGLHFLFPTLSWISKTPNARNLTLLLQPWTPHLLLPLPLLLLSLVPTAILVRLLQLLTRQPEFAAVASAQLLTTPGAVRNALAMARDEMRGIRRIGDDAREAVEELRARGGSVRAYWSKGNEDGWAPEWLRVQTEEALGLSAERIPALATQLVGSSGVAPYGCSPSSYTVAPDPLLHLRRRSSRAFSIDEIRAHRQMSAKAHETRDAILSAALSTTGGDGDASASASPTRRRRTTTTTMTTLPPPTVGSPRSTGGGAAAKLSASPTASWSRATAQNAALRYSPSSPSSAAADALGARVRRRTSLLNARARRALDGSIVIEAPDEVGEGRGDAEAVDDVAGGVGRGVGGEDLLHLAADDAAVWEAEALEATATPSVLTGTGPAGVAPTTAPGRILDEGAATTTTTTTGREALGEAAPPPPPPPSRPFVASPEDERLDPLSTAAAATSRRAAPRNEGADHEDDEDEDDPFLDARPSGQATDRRRGVADDDEARRRARRVGRRGGGGGARAARTTSAVSDEGGVPHAFCLRHAEHVAAVTARWLAQEL